MKSTKRKRPIYKDLNEVMSAICTVSNVWGYCLSWRFENPKLFNKFMELCAWYKKDDYYLTQKVTATEFLYHKKLKMDVLVVSTFPDEEDRICFWHADTRMWVHDKSNLFSQAKGKHS